MTFITGSMALSVKVIAGMPPRFRVAKLASKKGKETLFATKMAAKAELQRGNTELGNANTSKTVMAMAKARVTAAQKAEAPTMAQRAKKAPFWSSVGGWPSLVSIIDTNHSGKRTWPKTRPSNPPMIMVGATTPAGIADDNARMVIVHFIRKHRVIVPATPAQGRTQASFSLKSSVLSKMVEINSGCGLPPNRGSEDARTVFSVTTVATKNKSRHFPPNSRTKHRQRQAQQPRGRSASPNSGSWFPAAATRAGSGASRRRQRFKTPAV
mmetsp:Transcript_28605/g.46179  ORF Transcript_28605/g.46179 Transcript_28605/m.46179 type:complete len:268 (+) Transcript_28605:511-1314(+)